MKPIESLTLMCQPRMSIDWSKVISKLDDMREFPPDPWSALEMELARREKNLKIIQAQIDGPEETPPPEFNIKCDTLEEPLSPDFLPLFSVLYTELAS